MGTTIFLINPDIHDRMASTFERPPQESNGMTRFATLLSLVVLTFAGTQAPAQAAASLLPVADRVDLKFSGLRYDLSLIHI